MRCSFSRVRPRRTALLLGLLVVVSCAEGVAGPLIVTGSTRSINGSYILEALVVNDQQLDIHSGRSVTLNLNAVDRTDVTGTGPCNDFFASWSHSDGILMLADWVTTDLDCPTRDAIDVEATLFEALMQPLETTIDLDQTPVRLIMTVGDTTIIWSETTPAVTQPSTPPPFDGTTTTIPGGSDPGDVDVSDGSLLDAI